MYSIGPGGLGTADAPTAGMAKSNQRVVLGAGFEPEEIVALSRAVSSKSKDFEKARGQLKTGVYQVDVVARVKGDVELGISERTPEKFDGTKYLVAALAQLTAGQRKKVLARPVVRKPVAAVILAELQGLKAKLPKKVGPPKITPHLQVELVSVRGT